MKKCVFYEKLGFEKLDLFCHDTTSMSTISDYSKTYLRSKCIAKNYCDKNGKQFDENGKEVTTLQYLLLLQSVFMSAFCCPLAMHRMSRKIFFSAIKTTNKIKFLSKHVLKFILTKVVTKWVANISSIELKTCIEETVAKAKHSVQELQKAQTKNDSIIWNNLWHVEKLITYKASISLYDILHPWNHILCALKYRQAIWLHNHYGLQC